MCYISLYLCCFKFWKYLKFHDCIISVCYGNRFKSVRRITHTFTFNLQRHYGEFGFLKDRNNHFYSKIKMKEIWYWYLISFSSKRFPNRFVRGQISAVSKIKFSIMVILPNWKKHCSFKVIRIVLAAQNQRFPLELRNTYFFMWKKHDLSNKYKIGEKGIFINKEGRKDFSGGSSPSISVLSLICL